MLKNNYYSWLLLSGLAFALGSCSSAPTQPELADVNSGNSKITEENLKNAANESSIEIRYTLGRDHRRFLASSRENSAKANTYLEKELLEERSVKPERYADFLKKALIFVQNTPKNPAPDLRCRSPFVVILRVGSDTQVTTGCRSSDDGSLSKLVRDGEFLLYSKN